MRSEEHTSTISVVFLPQLVFPVQHPISSQPESQSRFTPSSGHFYVANADPARVPGVNAKFGTDFTAAQLSIQVKWYPYSASQAMPR